MNNYLLGQARNIGWVRMGSNHGPRSYSKNCELRVGRHGIEPWTSFLSGTRSTTEPPALICNFWYVATSLRHQIRALPRLRGQALLTTEPRTPTLAVFYHSFYEWPRSSYHLFYKWPSSAYHDHFFIPPKIDFPLPTS